MTQIIIHRYYYEDGSVIITPRQIEGGFANEDTLWRLIADEGMVLTNGTSNVNVVDTESPLDWTEISIIDHEEGTPSPISEEGALYIRAARIMLGEEE